MNVHSVHARERERHKQKNPLERGFNSSKSVSRVLYLLAEISIINLIIPLPACFINLPILTIFADTEASSSAFRTYLVFQLLRFTAIPVARKSRELLPHVFTLTLAGGIFSVALAVAGCRRLPVRKQDALCCPDFPLRNKPGAIERFADTKVNLIM
jgi:hypothetical protein